MQTRRSFIAVAAGAAVSAPSALRELLGRRLPEPAVTASCKPELAPHIDAAWSADSVVLVHPLRGSVALNTTGALLLSLCDGRRSISQLAGIVAPVVGVEPECLVDDTLALFGALDARGLVCMTA
jgi:Coenzyme PQQ synthesis protein D (PqqD)